MTQPITTDGTPKERATHPDTHSIPKRQDVPRHQWHVLRSSGQLDEGWIDREIIDKDGKLQPVADTTHATTSSQEQQTEILPAQGGDTYEHLSGDSARQLVGSVAAKASDTEVDNSLLVERAREYAEQR